MKNTLTVTQTQKLQLHPKLQQAIKLLHMSQWELDKAIEEALADNPLLEKNETIPEPIKTQQITAAVKSPNNTPSVDDDFVANIEAIPNFHQLLHEQVCEYHLNDRQSALIHILIDFLDDHGYLTSDIEEIMESTPLEWQLNEEELQQALSYLQQFDPAGVGARDLAESLILQISRKEEGEVTQCATAIIKQHFDFLSQANTALKVKKYLPYEMNVIESAIALIQSLNPYPDIGYNGTQEAIYIHPDVHVEKHQGQWRIREAQIYMPVVIQEDYANTVSETDDSVWKEKLQQARALIDNLSMRQNTIYRVAHFIVENQQDFFEFGPAGLKPMTLLQVAEVLGLHESTISRTVNKKYLSCPQGIFELRYFFSQAVGSDDEDLAMSNTAIKAHIAEWIAGENKSKPFSDQALSNKLQSIGLDVARRTVAKYREALNIPPAFRRKKT